MNRILSVISIALVLLFGAALGAAAGEQPEGPWGSEDPDSWCKAHGDYSDPEHATFPAECTAYWHPQHQEPEVELIPPKTEVKGHQPIVMSTTRYERAPLAATGSPLGLLSALGLVLVAAGALTLNAATIRSRRRLARLLEPYGVR